MIFAKTHRRKNKQGHLMILWLDDDPPPKGKFVVNFDCDWVGIYSEQRVTFHDKSTRNFSNCCHPPNTWKLNGIKVRHWLTQPAWTTGGFICYFFLPLLRTTATAAMLSLLTPPHGILFYIIYRNIQQYNIGGEYISIWFCAERLGLFVLFAARRERKILVSTGRDLYHISDSRTTGV